MPPRACHASHWATTLAGVSDEPRHSVPFGELAIGSIRRTRSHTWKAPHRQGDPRHLDPRHLDPGHLIIKEAPDTWNEGTVVSVMKHSCRDWQARGQLAAAAAALQTIGCVDRFLTYLPCPYAPRTMHHAM